MIRRPNADTFDENDVDRDKSGIVSFVPITGIVNLSGKLRKLKFYLEKMKPENFIMICF
jgi:hypothetical protein